MAVGVFDYTHVTALSQGMIKLFITRTLIQKTIPHSCRPLDLHNIQTEDASFIPRTVYGGRIVGS